MPEVKLGRIDPPETDWDKLATDSLNKALKQTYNTNLAKNIILFIGDGMGVSTVTAARIYKGQKQGHPGEETILKFEEFPHVALSKTYGNDRQVPDSAQTATALMSGYKTNFYIVGFNDKVTAGNCSAETEENKLKSILHHFNDAGSEKITGDDKFRQKGSTTNMLHLLELEKPAIHKNNPKTSITVQSG